MKAHIEMKKNIANTITLSSLSLAVLSIVESCNYNFITALYFLFACFILDGFDGFIARSLKTNNEFGKQLDSIHDMIAFGVGPGLLMYNFILFEFNNENLAYTAIFIPICSALRLANYNIDMKQNQNFIGLTTPFNVIFFGSLILINHTQQNTFLEELIINPSAITILILTTSILLISPLKTFSLRLDSTIKDKIKLFFIFISTLILYIFNVSGIFITCCMYIILCLIKQTTNLK